MDQKAFAREPGSDGLSEGLIDIRRIWNGTTKLGECPLWDDRLQRLYWIDCLSQKIWHADADGRDARSIEVPDTVGSIALCEDGRLVAGLAGGFALIELNGGEALVQWLGDPEPDIVDTRLNDGKVDRQGRFWCGSMNRDFAQANASLYRLDPDLTWHCMEKDITVSNGLAFSLDGKKLYFSDSRVDRSYQYDLDAESGRISNRQAFVDTTAYKGRIDGATVDSEGNYWGALFAGSAVACFSPDGKLIRSIEVPVRHPTMCSFGGPQMDILYVTSATFSMTPEEIASEPMAGSLFAIHNLGTRGVAEPRFVTN